MSSSIENPHVFLVLGASGGIGSQVACQLCAAGHHVLLASRKSDRLDGLANDLGASKCELDATNISEVEACFSDAFHEFGRIDGAVNCVGSLLLKPAHMTRESEWNDTLATPLEDVPLAFAKETLPDDQWNPGRHQPAK